MRRLILLIFFITMMPLHAYAANVGDIFANWDNYPDNAGQWELVQYQGDQVIRSTINTSWSGFWTKQVHSADYFKFEFDMGVTENEDDDNIGFTFKMDKFSPSDPRNPYQGNYDAYSFYAFTLDGGGAVPGGLYKIVNAPFPNVDVGSHTMWTRTWTGGNRNWPDNYYHQSGDSKPNQSENPSGAKGYMKLLQYTQTSSLRSKYLGFQNVKVETSGNHIKVWVDDSLEIDYVDNNSPLDYGGYGPFAASQAYGSFKNIRVNVDGSNAPRDAQLVEPNIGTSSYYPYLTISGLAHNDGEGGLTYTYQYYDHTEGAWHDIQSLEAVSGEVGTINWYNRHLSPGNYTVRMVATNSEGLKNISPGYSFAVTEDDVGFFTPLAGVGMGFNSDADMVYDTSSFIFELLSGSIWPFLIAFLAVITAGLLWKIWRKMTR